MDVSEDVTCTLRAQDHGHPPLVMAAGFRMENSADSRSIGYEEEISPTLKSNAPAVLALENHPADSRVKISEDGKVQTLCGRMGTGGGNVPLVVTPKPLTLKIRCGKEGGGKGALIQKDKSATLATNNDQVSLQPRIRAFGVCGKRSGAMLSDNPRTGFYEAKTSRTLDQRGGDPTCAQGGICVVAPEPDPAGRHAVAQPVYAATMGGFLQVSEEKANTLMARDFKDPQFVNVRDCAEEDFIYIVRRIIPKECARLQGFPDDWTEGLENEELTPEEIRFWTEVWAEHWRLIGSAEGVKQPKTEKQVRSWLKNPGSDTAKYKMWGNV